MKLDQRAIDQLLEVGGEELLRQMVDLFLELTPERLNEIAVGLDEADPDRIMRAAHFLRSSFGNLGASEPSRLATAIEARAGDGRLEEIGPMLDQLRAGFREAAELLRRRVGADDER